MRLVLVTTTVTKQLVSAIVALWYMVVSVISVSEASGDSPTVSHVAVMEERMSVLMILEPV